jgi:hypothetical protein
MHGGMRSRFVEHLGGAVRAVGGEGSGLDIKMRERTPLNLHVTAARVGLKKCQRLSDYRRERNLAAHSDDADQSIRSHADQIGA